MLCPECSGTAVSPEGTAGEKVCTHCGLVIEQTPTTRHSSRWSPEWPSNWNSRDSETLREWLTELRLVSCQLNIPNFPYREEAARLIRKQKALFFQSQRLAKNKRETVAALLQLILKQYGKEHSIKTICQQLSLNKELVMKQNWNLNDKIKTNTPLLQTPTKKPKNYLYNYGTEITHPQLLTKTEEILAKIQKKGGNPISLAAGALYYICKKEKTRTTKEAIGKAFNISSRTVDTNERKIRRFITTTTTKHLHPLTINQAA